MCFIGDGVIFKNFLNRGWKMYPSRRCSGYFREDVPSSFVNLMSLSSVLRCCPSLIKSL